MADHDDHSSAGEFNPTDCFDTEFEKMQDLTSVEDSVADSGDVSDGISSEVLPEEAVTASVSGT